MGYLDNSGLSHLWGKIKSLVKKESQDIYSLEEQRIGTWVDGRPLYRQTYLTATSFNSDAGNYKFVMKLDQNVAISICKSEMLIRRDDDEYGGANPLPRCVPTSLNHLGGYWIQHAAGSEDAYELCIRIGTELYGEMNNRIMIFTICYTKKEDALA